MKSTLVFLDGGFLSKLNRYFGEGVYTKYDIIKFARNLAKKQDLFCEHIFYYNAPPFQETPPTLEQRKKKEKYDRFAKTLYKNKNITLREGRVQKIINESGEIQYSQKGVDTLMTIDLSHIKEDYPEINKIILVSSDTDFCPIIRDIKKRWKIEVILYSYFDRKRGSKFSVSNELLSCCPRYCQLTKRDFEDAKFEKSLRDD